MLFRSPILPARRRVNILDVNPAASRQYGFDHDEFILMNAAEVSAEPEQTIRAINRPVGIIPLRYHHRKDGSIFPVEITASTFELQGKTIIIATARDITERRRVEAAITESFAIFKTVMDSLDALVYVSDMKTHEILFINQYGKEIFGDIIGKI